MSYIKSTIVRIFLSFVLLAAFPTLSLAAKSTAKLLTTDKKTGDKRSESSFFVRPDKKEETMSQVVMGRGDDDQYKDARYLKTSVLQGGQMLKPIKTEAVYYNKADDVIGGFTFAYDYTKETVIFTRLKEEKKKDFSKTFKIKGPICDSLNLPVFLERFLVLHEGLSYKHFYLLSTEPKLYKVNIYYRGIDTLDIDDKSVRAKKIQLIGDMGPLTEAIAKYLPKTYLWFTPKRPYRWLKYEGLERGHNSANIIVNVVGDK